MFPNRHNDMRHSAKNIEQELEKLMCLGQEKTVFQPLVKRINGTPVRAYFVHKIYEEIKTTHKRGRFGLPHRIDESFFVKQLPLLFEGVIAVQYLHNQILDQKCGVQSHQKINANLLQANLLKDYLYEYIATYVPASIERKVSACLRRIFRYVDIGQQLEKEWNTHARFVRHEAIPESILPVELEQFIEMSELAPLRMALQKELPRDYWEFLDLYLKRIYLTCGALFILAVDLITELLATPEETRLRLRRFAISYGMMRQVINDNADVVPSSLGLATHSKFPEDAFSDLRNRNITLPLMLHLAQHPNGQIGQWLSSDETMLSPQQELAFSEELQQSFAIYQSIQFGKLLARMSLQHLSAQNTPALMLADSCNIAEWNKFLSPLIKTPQYRLYRKSSAYRRCKRTIRRLGRKHEASKNAVASPVPLFGLAVTA